MSLTLTPTEQRIYNLLSDGLPHTTEEMKNVIGEGHPEEVSIALVYAHVARMRKKLEEGRALGVSSHVRNGAHTYRLVALINKQDDG
jgi:DNA-binding response OmpR family regulator